jgi:hypothetical protein
MVGVSEQTRVAGRQNVRKCRSRNARALVPNPDRGHFTHRPVKFTN